MSISIGQGRFTAALHLEPETKDEHVLVDEIGNLIYKAGGLDVRPLVDDDVVADTSDNNVDSIGGDFAVFPEA